MIGVTVIRTVVRYSYQVLFESVGQSALFDLRKDMYVKLQELDFDFFNHTRVGDIMARMTGIQTLSAILFLGSLITS